MGQTRRQKRLGPLFGSAYSGHSLNLRDERRPIREGHLLLRSHLNSRYLLPINRLLPFQPPGHSEMGTQGSEREVPGSDDNCWQETACASPKLPRTSYHTRLPASLLCSSPALLQIIKILLMTKPLEVIQ